MACHKQHNNSATEDSAAACKRSRRQNAIVDDPKQLAAMFASMVTVPASENEWIARNGDESLFKVLQQIVPEVRSKSSADYLTLYIPFRVVTCRLTSSHFPKTNHSCSAQICQPEDGRHRFKGRITGTEFNKVLGSQSDFVCARTRKLNLSRPAPKPRLLHL